MKHIPENIDDLMFVLNKVITYKNEDNKKNIRRKLIKEMKSEVKTDILLQASNVIYDMYMNQSIEVKPEKETILENKLLEKEKDEYKLKIDELESNINGLRKSNHRLRENLQIAETQIEVLKDKQDDNELEEGKIKWYENKYKKQLEEITMIRNNYTDVIELNKKIVKKNTEYENKNKPDNEKDLEISNLKLQLEKANEEEYYRNRFREIDTNGEMDIKSEMDRLKKQERNKHYYKTRTKLKPACV
tara:strand:- start:407 stop:1144 length:738 start_codon:yes stop_codon:yes gene_type:complete